jgi:glycosyltransferase involved in cell wall biosynthesis
MEERATGNAPAVTVLMAVRNGERHLRPAVESVLDQSFEDFEFLIVDDASVDTTLAVVKSYDDPRIRLVENPDHRGLAASLNRGIGLARGRYLARMDADDVSAPERLERQVAFLDAHPQCALVATYARKIDASGSEVGVAHTPLSSEDIRQLLRRGNCITHGTVMARTEALRRVGSYDPAMERSQDYDLWLRLSEEFDLGTLPEYLYSWREHEASISGRHLAEQDRYAALARQRALSRRVLGLLEELVAAGASAEAAARRVLDLFYAEQAARTPLVAGGRWVRWWRSVGPSSRWLWTRRRERRSAARGLLTELVAGRADAAATAAALVAFFEEGAP